jgi:hypothetical protein
MNHNTINYQNKTYVWPLNKSDFEFFYHREKMTVASMGSLFGVSGGTISWLRKKYLLRKIECWERKQLPDLFSEKESEVIFGHLLGDGHLGLSSKYPYMRVSQCSKQKMFVLQLYSYLQRWASYAPVTDKKFDNRYGKTYVTCRFDTVRHPEFARIYELCYPGGTKTITEEWLQHISPLSLAMWYQGDGQLNGRTMPLLNTDSYSKREHDIMIAWFNTRYGIRAYTRPKSYGRYLTLCIEDGDRFGDIIKPYIIDEFNYKLPKNRLRRKRHHE